MRSFWWTRLAVLLLMSDLLMSQSNIIEMQCDPSFEHRYDACPKGYCCVRDEFLPTYVYCKQLGQARESCSTRTSESDCPCDASYYCQANIQGTFPSVYGKCTLNVTTTRS